MVAKATMAGTLVIAPKSVIFRRHDHLVSVLFEICSAIPTTLHFNVSYLFVSAHRRILGMAPVVCVLVKICVSSISFYKLDTDKLTTPFESAHQFTLVCTVSDSKTVPGCHYNLCSITVLF